VLVRQLGAALAAAWRRQHEASVVPLEERTQREKNQPQDAARERAVRA
jgi:hypothetical protein